MSMEELSIANLKRRVLVETNQKTNWRPFCIITTVFCTLWVINWFFANSLQEPGVFGDMFGASNSLFSGLALAGVVYSLWLQKKELELQRQITLLTFMELQESTAAQRGSEDALKDQVETLSVSAKLNAYATIYSAKATLNSTGRLHDSKFREEDHLYLRLINKNIDLLEKLEKKSTNTANS